MLFYISRARIFLLRGGGGGGGDGGGGGGCPISSSIFLKICFKFSPVDDFSKDGGSPN